MTRLIGAGFATFCLVDLVMMWAPLFWGTSHSSLPEAITLLFLAFGLTMQFPIVIYILSRVGIVSSARLRAARRYVILGIAIFATVITPGGDIVSPTVLGVVMYILFELSIFAVKRSGR